MKIYLRKQDNNKYTLLGEYKDRNGYEYQKVLVINCSLKKAKELMYKYGGGQV